MRKVNIDQRVAALLGVKVDHVREVTDAFLRILMELLMEEGRVAVDGFGVFRFYQQTGKTPRVEQLRSTRGEPLLVDTQRKFRVSFQKLPAFKSLIWERFGKAPTEKVMEKTPTPIRDETCLKTEKQAEKPIESSTKGASSSDSAGVAGVKTRKENPRKGKDSARSA